MFNANDIYPDIDINDIKNKISEYDIFSRYCLNFKEIDKSFKSEFYDDKNAGCYITNSGGRLLYKDFGSTDVLSCWDYIMKKYNCDFKEMLNIISNDFNLSNIKTTLKPQLLIGREDSNKNFIIEKKKITISIIAKNWDINDYNYWFKYSITFSLLDKYNVIPCSSIYITRGNKTSIIYSSKADPIYAYKFIDDDGIVSYKIYRPLSKDRKYKFIFNGSKYNIEGFDQLDWIGDKLIITKSLKDVMCLRLMGFNAISLQGEANTLDSNIFNKIKNRFKEIIVLYDQDKQGIESSNKISKQYNLKSILIPLEFKSKDTSDLIVNKGFDKAKSIIIKLINE